MQSRQRRGILFLLIALAALAWFLSATHGKDCHYNVNLNPRLVCTEPSR